MSKLCQDNMKKSSISEFFPLHLYDQCHDMGRTQNIAKKHKLHIIGDCAQDHGSLWDNKIAGSMSTISALSFYQTKTLGAYGDAGIMVTQSNNYAKKAKC